MRWKFAPKETGLRSVGAGPRERFLGKSNEEWLIRVSAIGGGHIGPVKGWYWYGMGQNTSQQPKATMEEAQAEADAFYKASLKTIKASDQT